MSRAQRSGISAGIDPRSHYLVILTRAQLAGTRLALPVFEIRNGRLCRFIDGASAEGLRVLEAGRNVLYVGIPGGASPRVDDSGLRSVLESLRDHEACADLRDALDRHIGEFEAAVNAMEAA